MATVRLTDPGNFGRMRVFQETQIMPATRVELQQLSERKEELATITQMLDHVEWRLKRFRRLSEEDDLWLIPSVQRISRVGGDLRQRVARIGEQLRERIGR